MTTTHKETGIYTLNDRLVAQWLQTRDVRYRTNAAELDTFFGFDHRVTELLAAQRELASAMALVNTVALSESASAWSGFWTGWNADAPDASSEPFDRALLEMNDTLLAGQQSSAVLGAQSALAGATARLQSAWSAIVESMAATLPFPTLAAFDDQAALTQQLRREVRQLRRQLAASIRDDEDVSPATDVAGRHSAPGPGRSVPSRNPNPASQESQESQESPARKVA